MIDTPRSGRLRILKTLPERIGLKPQARSGEIKRRLFITPILFLPGRDRYHLSTVNCQLSTENLNIPIGRLPKLTLGA